MEEKRQRLQLAVASNNLASIASLITDETSIGEKIGEVLGDMFYTYYAYVDNYHCKPYDLRDLVDGLLYLDIKSKQLEELRRKDEQDNNRAQSYR